jgi:hypothetical protein
MGLFEIERQALWLLPQVLVIVRRYALEWPLEA